MEKTKIVQGSKEWILSERMICSLFDLQYMMEEETWETIKLNKELKYINKFFRIVEEVDGRMHEVNDVKPGTS